MEEFDYKVVYTKGKLKTNADAFSRMNFNTKETKKLTRMEKYVEELNERISRQDQENDDVSVCNDPRSDNENERDIEDE